MNVFIILFVLAAGTSSTAPTTSATATATGPATAATTATTTAAEDDLVKGYVLAAERAQKRFADEVTAAKKARDAEVARAEKAMRVESDRATRKYVAAAEKATARYAEQLKVAIAATIAAYDGSIERARRRGQKEKVDDAAAARKAFSSRAREDNQRLVAAARELAGVEIAASGEPTTVPAGRKRGPVIADHIVAVVDDFIVDVYHNGKKVPDSSRRLEVEIHGATVERIDVEVRGGDWIVFNVANNRLRWGGQCLFMAAGKLNEGDAPAFVTTADDRHWSACDDTDQVKKFIAYPAWLSDRAAKQPQTPWGTGLSEFNRRFPDSGAQPIWGESRNTWIKFVAE